MYIQIHVQYTNRTCFGSFQPQGLNIDSKFRRYEATCRSDATAVLGIRDHVMWQLLRPLSGTLDSCPENRKYL